MATAKKKTAAKGKTKSAKDEEPDATVSRERENATLSRFLAGREVENGEKDAFTEDAKVIQGIRIPSIAMAWTVNMDVWPMRAVVGVSGPSGSMKSSFGFWINSLIVGRGGYGMVNDSEGDKVSPNLASSIIGWDVCRKGRDQKFKIEAFKTINECQKKCQNFIEHVRKEKIAGTPLCVGIDSLSAAMTESARNKIWEQGGIERAFPSTALAWSQWMKFLAPELLDIPMFFYFVSHLTEKINTGHGKSHGPPEQTTTGGRQQRFTASFHLWIKRLSRQTPTSQQYVMPDGKKIRQFREYRSLGIHCEKSSYGPDGRRIPVDFVWWHENGKQVSIFDWDAADAWFLADAGNEEKPMLDRHALEDACYVEENSSRFTCKALGVTREPDYVLGRALRENPEIVNDILTSMHVQRGKDLFVGGAVPSVPESAGGTDQASESGSDPEDDGEGGQED